jgi:Icc protein
MPISLPPLSRRQFLARSLAAGAACVLAPELHAESKATDPNAFALLSDTHLAADRSKIGRGINMADHFIAVSREVRAWPQRPAAVFINGDCAFNSGESGDYALLAEFLEPIRADQMPVHLLLGNHDNRERFWDVLRAEKTATRPLADKQVALLKTPRANWFILDSLETTLSTPGLLGSGQLEWLGKALDANADKPALIMIHHNPGISGGNIGLKDTAALFELLRPRKQVKAYFFGHTHHWEVTRDESGIHLINLPPVSYLFHEGDPAGWVMANVEEKGIRLELRSLDTSHKAHGKPVNFDWRA